MAAGMGKAHPLPVVGVFLRRHGGGEHAPAAVTEKLHGDFPQSHAQLPHGRHIRLVGCARGRLRPSGFGRRLRRHRLGRTRQLHRKSHNVNSYQCDDCRWCGLHASSARTLAVPPEMLASCALLAWNDLQRASTSSQAVRLQ